MPFLVLSPQRVIKMTKLAGIVSIFLAIILMAGCAVTSEARRDAAATATSISPTSATAGSASQLVLVTGTDFATNTVVLVNGSPRATDFVSVNKLTTMLTTADLAHASVIEISVAAGTTTPALRPRAQTSGAQGLAFTVEASASALQILTSSLPAATIQASYSDSLAAQGGVAPYSWKVTAGQLPPGISLSSSAGTLSGTPTQTGAFSFSAAVSDSSSTPQTAAELLTLSVGASVAPLTINFSAFPGGITQSSYASTASATGGITPYTWSVALGSLPTGLSLNSSTGAITGSPTAAGTSNFSLQVKDSSPTPQTASATTSILVVATLKIATASLAVPQIQKAYSTTLTTSGGMAPYVWSVAAGALPTGLSLNSSTGVISGTPTTAGTYAFTLRVDDPPSLPQTASHAFSSTVSAAVTTLQITSPVTMASGTMGTPYTYAFAASGGTPPYTWTGGPRFGLTLSSSGVYSGTPNTAGTSTFVLCVNDSLGAQFCNGTTNPTPESMTVLPSTSTTSLAITTTNLPGGQVQTPYQGTLIASGGTVPYTWSVTSGTLPTPLALLASTGQISGTPSTAGTSNLTFQVRDSAGASASASLAISIASKPSLTMVTTSLPSGTVGANYSATLQAAGGTQPYVWSVTSGGLPAGLSLGASSGSVSGVPTTSGTTSFTVEVTDAKSLVASLGSTVTVASATTGGSGQASPTYNGRTDLLPAPETVPTRCSPAPCTMTSSDLNPGVLYHRVTDPNILPGITGHGGFGTTNSIDFGWSIDDSSFEVNNIAGSLIPFKFNTSTLATGTIPCTNVSDSNCSGPGANGFVNLPATDGAYSRITPNKIYISNGTSIESIDFRGTLSNPATSTITTIVGGPGACSGAASSSLGTILTGSAGDQRFSAPMGPSQDNYVGAYVIDTTMGCRYLNTSTMTVGGAWGTSGAVVMYDENGNVTPTVTYSDSHGSQIDPTGRWVTIDSEGGQYEDFWDVATNNIYRCGTTTGSGTCAGHGVWGYSNDIWFFLNSTESLFQTHTFPAALPSQQIYPNSAPPIPSGFGGYQADAHLNWNNNAGNNAAPMIVNPICQAEYNCPAPTVAWLNELIMVPPSGTGPIWRIAHTYSREADFYGDGLPQISPSGKFAIFGSDWGGSGRDDLYLIQLPLQ